MKLLGVFAVSLLASSLAVGPALAANCGDTSGGGGTDVPCSCGDRLTTSTTLTAADPVTTALCPGNGLIVNPGLTLNLGGRAIQGASGNNGFGIAMHTGVIVRGPGTVSRFFNVGLAPIGLETGQQILSVRSTGNGFGISCNGNCLITGNTASGNQLDGIYPGDHSTTRNNVASSNGRDGIVLIPVSGGTLYSNTVRLNGRDGIFVSTGSSGLTLQKNMALQNVRHGINLDSNVSASLLDTNEVTGNQSNGIRVTGSDNALNSNKAESNKGDGIRVTGNDNLLTLNTGKISGGHGIEVIGNGNHLKDNHGDQNALNGVIASPQGGANADDGKNTGNANAGPVQCQIDGVACAP